METCTFCPRISNPSTRFWRRFGSKVIRLVRNKSDELAMAITPWMFVAAGFALVNTVLILVLLALYSSSARKIRTTFTLGLILFTIFFLAQNISIVILWYQLYSIAPSATAVVNTAAPYMTVINAVEAFALAIMVAITAR
jgi:hypothetical protein